MFFGAHDPRVHFSHSRVHVKDPLSVEVEVAGRAKLTGNLLDTFLGRIELGQKKQRKKNVGIGAALWRHGLKII